MKIKLKIEQEVDLKELHVSAGVRYWEDSTVNGIEDELGDLIPCRVGNLWKPIIDIETGIITNWKQGVKAEIHYKVCDDGIYTVKDTWGADVLERDGYVPDTMSPGGSGYGDYIIMNVDENGKIDGWEFDIDDFKEEE